MNYLTHVALEVDAGLCNFLSALKLEQVYHLGHGRVSVCDLAVCPRHNLLGPRGSCRVHEFLDQSPSNALESPVCCTH